MEFPLNSLIDGCISFVYNGRRIVIYDHYGKSIRRGTHGPQAHNTNATIYTLAPYCWGLQPLHAPARHTQISASARRRNWLLVNRTTRAAYLVLAQRPWRHPSRTKPRFCIATPSPLWFPHHQHCLFPHQTDGAACPKWTHHEEYHAAIPATGRSTIRSPPGPPDNLHRRRLE